LATAAQDGILPHICWAGFWILIFVASVITEPAPGHVLVVGAAVLRQGTGARITARGHEFVNRVA
jgi:hypothetical protein